MGVLVMTSTLQLPFKTPQIPFNRDYKAVDRGTLEGLGNAVELAKVYSRHQLNTLLANILAQFRKEYKRTVAWGSN